MKQYQQDNRDAINKNKRIWRKKKMKENPEGIRAKNREYYKNHQENKIKKLGIEEVRRQNNAIATAYKESLPAYIYGIQNKNNSKIYVGMTTQGIMRWSKHKSALRSQKHHVSSLQEDWNKHGERAFVFEIIEELPCDTAKDELITKEEEYIKQYLNEGKVLYNIERRTNV
jgi:predicted GIY-YIG superfamily endonuclease